MGFLQWCVTQTKASTWPSSASFNGIQCLIGRGISSWNWLNHSAFNTQISSCTIQKRGIRSPTGFGMLSAITSSCSTPLNACFTQVKHIEADMLGCLTFLPRALLTATKHGHVRMWVRPLVTPGNPRRRMHGRQPLSISDLHDVV